ncbi:hypothetical protein [Sphingomonas sp. M1-B02]|uniref:hypothetical protein n=1 Tax=Sphingomonas sp. M1-B02 TaxID=3114300 RepID=UPI00223F957C|nr:hypothetical protein [Sphingomonas sp. S6-11]UZK67543.1 hypothetical protein OKW87_06860 [Sphingomonas sp. S6-11]
MFVMLPYPRFRPLAIALYALGGTLLLGVAGPAMPGLWELLGALGLLPLLGLVLAGGAGLLACHLAQLTAVPLGRASFAKAALPAFLIPAAAIPAMGVAALLPPLAIAVILARRVPEQRDAGLIATLGTLAGLAAAGLGNAWLGSGASIAMLAAAWLSLHRSGKPAGNDDPGLERMRDIMRLPEGAAYARQRGGSRSPCQGD